jgi:hypothetical protein
MELTTTSRPAIDLDHTASGSIVEVGTALGHYVGILINVEQPGSAWPILRLHSIDPDTDGTHLVIPVHEDHLVNIDPLPSIEAGTQVASRRYFDPDHRLYRVAEFGEVLRIQNPAGRATVYHVRSFIDGEVTLYTRRALQPLTQFILDDAAERLSLMPAL